MSLLWPTAAHACMTRNVAGTLLQIKARHARGYGPRSDDQVFVLREIELVHHATEQMNIDLPSRSNETGADFYDHAHLVLGCCRGANFACHSLPCCSDLENTASRGVGQHLYRAVRMAFLAR